jgi:hypothetical protein
MNLHNKRLEAFWYFDKLRLVIGMNRDSAVIKT